MAYRILNPVFCIFIISLFACNSPKKAGNIQIEKENKTEHTGRIYFVVLKIKADSISAKNTVTLVSSKPVEGTFKKQQNPDLHTANKLIIYHYEQEKLKDSLVIPHPLFKDIEYLTDDNTFSRKMIKLAESEFFFRLQTKGNTNKIIIFEELENKARTKLNTLNL